MKEKEIDREGKQAKDSQQTDKEIPISVSLPLSFNSLSTVYSLVLYPGQYVYTTHYTIHIVHNLLFCSSFTVYQNFIFSDRPPPPLKFLQKLVLPENAD